MRCIKSKYIDTRDGVARYEQEWVGLSTDAKPVGTNLAEGSTFFEEDTSEEYMLRANGSWGQL